MKATSLLVATSVAGALVIGGVATGATLAAWHDQAAADAGPVRSGTIAMTAGVPETVRLSGITDLRPGEPQAVEVSVANASPAAAKNLHLRASVTSVAGHDGSELPLAVDFRPSGAGCSTTGTFDPTLGTALTGALAPGETGRICVRVAMTATTLPATATSTTITLTLTGTQVQP